MEGNFLSFSNDESSKADYKKPFCYDDLTDNSKMELL